MCPRRDEIPDYIEDYQLTSFSFKYIPRRECGKRRFMAPEVFNGENSSQFVNPMLCDIWALGIILFACLTGEFPMNFALPVDPAYNLIVTKQISVKQTIHTKSSAEPELVAVSDGATPVINVQNIILSQGLQCEPAMLDQDNQSTLTMLDKGQATGPTQPNGVQQLININQLQPISENAADLIQKMLRENPDERITIPQIRNHPFMQTV
jgi:serine/threonine protein kinase